MNIVEDGDWRNHIKVQDEAASAEKVSELEESSSEKAYKMIKSKLKLIPIVNIDTNYFMEKTETILTEISEEETTKPTEQSALITDQSSLSQYFEQKDYMLPNIVTKFSKMDRVQNSDLENVGIIRSKRVIKSAY